MQPELEYVEHLKEAPLKCMVVSIENSSPHWHYEYEVFFVLRGGVTVNAENGVCRLERGDLILFNSREIHSITQADKENLCLVMQFSPGILLEVYESSFLFDLNTKSDNPPKPEILTRFRRILAEIGLLLYDKPDGYQFAIKSGLYQFISLLFGNLCYRIEKGEAAAGTDEQLEDFDLITQYIKTHFKDDMTMDELCREVGMSRAKVFRTLKAAGSSSVKDLTNYYRVEYAKNLLGSTALAIPYISSESGFDSDSSFYRIFKEVTGSSPNHYRVSPDKSNVPLGIQGYAAFPVSDAIRLLREVVSPAYILHV
jgi:AraC-like DNA-binding protein